MREHVMPRQRADALGAGASCTAAVIGHALNRRVTVVERPHP